MCQLFRRGRTQKRHLSLAFRLSLDCRLSYSTTPLDNSGGNFRFRLAESPPGLPGLGLPGFGLPGLLPLFATGSTAGPAAATAASSTVVADTGVSIVAADSS